MLTYTFTLCVNNSSSSHDDKDMFMCTSSGDFAIEVLTQVLRVSRKSLYRSKFWKWICLLAILTAAFAASIQLWFFALFFKRRELRCNRHAINFILIGVVVALRSISISTYLKGIELTWLKHFLPVENRFLNISQCFFLLMSEGVISFAFNFTISFAIPSECAL